MKNVDYDVTLRIVSKVDSDDLLSQEVCDIMTVSRAVSKEGVVHDHASWREVLVGARCEQSFWEYAVERYVMIQVCIKTMEPGHA